MTKAELNDIINKLWRLAYEDGDNGNEYWNQVIQKLITLRDKTL